MQAKELGELRQNAHPTGTKRFYSDPNTEDRIGAAGELAFAKQYGLDVDEEARPGGDGHIDFKVGKVTIDVKTARKAYNLLVKEWEIDKAADVLVLGQYINDEHVEFLGWIHRENLRMRDKKDFGKGIVSYYVAAGNLNPMKDLEGVMGWQDPSRLVDTNDGDLWRD